MMSKRQRKLPPVEEILVLREAGETLESIGKRFGVTRQAVHELLKKYQQKCQAVDKQETTEEKNG